MFTSEFIKTLTDDQAEMLWNTHVQNDHITFHVCGSRNTLIDISKDISPEQYSLMLTHIRMSIIAKYCKSSATTNIHAALQNLKPDYTLEMVAKLYDNALVDMMQCPALASFSYIPKEKNQLASYKSMVKYFGRDKLNSILFTALNPVK